MLNRMTYAQWLATFRAEGFWLYGQAQELVMPAQTLTQDWHNDNISPLVAARIWFGDSAHFITAQKGSNQNA